MNVIGITGKPGSGKDVLAEWLCEHREMENLSFGDRVREYAEKRGIEPSRDNLQDAADQLISEKGPDFLADQMARRIQEEHKTHVVISGVRTPDDAQTLRRYFHEAFILVAVQTDSAQERFRRIRQRDEARDTQSYEQFIWTDQKEEQLFHVRETEKMADVTIPNNDSLLKFKFLIRDRVLPLMEAPAS